MELTWISVKKIPPPIYERVLLTIEYVAEDSEEPIRRTVDGCASDSIGNTYTYWGGRSIDRRIWRVTDWMPWPDPARRSELAI